MKNYINIILIILTVCSCNKKGTSNEKEALTPQRFDRNTLAVKENNFTKKVLGQVLYIPIYSNVPYHEYEGKFDLSAFVAIHNTDLYNKIKITKVLFFNNDGQLVANYLLKDTSISPLGAINFFIPEHDKSGTGANFLVEWTADSLVNEPLIESVMLGLTSGQGISFSSTGKVIRENR